MLLTAAVAMIMMAPQGAAPQHSSSKKLAPENIYAFKMKDIDGKEVPLSKFKGKTLLIVNTASKCGMTPQYEGLQSLYEKYKGKGLVVLGFPANDFRGQEHGTDAEIKEFCTSKYDVSFPMFSKISVLGETAHPLYKWLLASTDGQPIEWNFSKFLVGPDGKVVKRFGSRVAPGSEELVAAVEQTLAN